MPYIQGENRGQLSLTPLCLDDYIAADNICRVIVAYVAHLDMAAMEFKYAETKSTGRPPYDPKSMLMLYLYGYLNRIRSSRRLEAETRRNVELMWLMEKLTPDDRTINNFRKDNTAALKKAFRAFSLWCNEQGLYGKQLVAVDGSKFRANCSRKRIYGQKMTEKELAFVDKKITEYMNELNENDATEANEAQLSPDAIRGLLQHLNDKKEVLQDRLKQIELNGGGEISSVDPDAHIMHSGGDARNLDACYNVQTVVDAKHKLIVDFDVSDCPDDTGALQPMTEKAKEIFGVEEIIVVADKGYYDGDGISACESAGTTCIIPKAKCGRTAPDPKYNHEKFKYNAAEDNYTCPQGNILFARAPHKRKDGKSNRTYANFAACRLCQYKTQCTKDKRGRQIARNPDQEALDAVDARMCADEIRQIFKQRKKIVEHPFGTTKHIWGYKQFLCRGKEKVTAEQSLCFLAYNFRRVFNIFKERDKNMVEMLV